MLPLFKNKLHEMMLLLDELTLIFFSYRELLEIRLWLYYFEYFNQYKLIFVIINLKSYFSGFSGKKEKQLISRCVFQVTLNTFYYSFQNRHFLNMQRNGKLQKIPYLYWRYTQWLSKVMLKPDLILPLNVKM